MPHSGYIKRFVLEDTGYKFYTAEDITYKKCFKSWKYNHTSSIWLPRSKFLLEKTTLRLSKKKKNLV